MKLNFKLSPELIFNLYFWGFILLRPILRIAPKYSKAILFTYALLILLLSIINSIKYKINLNHYKISLLIISILLFDYYARPNILIGNYIYQFIIYGLIPIHLISQIRNRKRFLYIFCYFSVISFFAYFWDPFQGYKLSNDYMYFGYIVGVPVFMGLNIGRNFLKIKWLIIIEVLWLFLLILYGNRGTILSIILFVIINITLFSKSVRTKIISLVVVFGSVLGIIIFSGRFINLFYESNLAKNPSYSFSQYKNLLIRGDIEQFYSGRLYIWELAKKEAKDNMLFGKGTAYFESKYGAYTHNIFYDILIEHGIFGVVISSLVILIIVVRIFNKKAKVNKLIGILFLCLSFPKLFFSFYYFKDISIWCLIAVGLLNNNYYISNEKRYQVFVKENKRIGKNEDIDRII